MRIRLLKYSKSITKSSILRIFGHTYLHLLDSSWTILNHLQKRKTVVLHGREVATLRFLQNRRVGARVLIANDSWHSCLVLEGVFGCGGIEEMRNACPMPSLSCGRGIALHRCLTTRSVSCSPRSTATSSSSSSSLQQVKNGFSLASATRRVEFSFARAFGGGGGVVFVGQETPTQWKRRSWSSVRPISSLGKKPEDDGDAKSEVLESVVAAAAAGGGGGGELNRIGKPETCTADELHYVAVPGTAWRLALWRYLPNLKAQKRNHPVLMLSGIGTNAIGFDLDPKVSLARHLSAAGFDTWILEVRGAGLSKREGELTSSELGGKDGALTGAVQDAFVRATLKSATDQVSQNTNNTDENDTKKQEVMMGDSKEVVLNGNKIPVEEETAASRLTNTILQISERLRGLVSEGQSRILSARFIEQVSALLEDSILSERLGELRERLTSLLEGQQNNSMASQITDFTKRVAQVLEEGQRSVTPSVSNLQERLTTTISDFQETLDLIAKYDWDFDSYLEEDVPAAMEYVIKHSGSVDGKILSVGHSMGGILLYAMLAIREERAGLAGAVTLASSLDYGVGDSSLKKLLPLTDPAEVLNVPVIPLGALMSAIHPLVARPPYALAYLGYQVSARQMMDPVLFQKLVTNNFCTIPVKLLLQLATTFQPGGLRNRQGKVIYKNRLRSCKVPVLAIAGDQDLICPPLSVTDTLKAFPEASVTYKLFGGEQDDRHYGHYDLLCSRTARQEIFPVIENFLARCDRLEVESGS